MRNHVLVSSLVVLALACSGKKEAETSGAASGGGAAGGEAAGPGAAGAASGAAAGTSGAGAGAATTPTPPAALPADAGEHTGKHRWSMRLGGPLADSGRAVAVSARGDVAIAGYFRDTLDLGTGEKLVADDVDAFVALRGADGAVKWARGFGGKGQDAADAVAIDPQGNVIVGGAFSYELVMADGKLESKGADDMFVIKLAPDGRRLWAKRFGDLDVDAVYGLATDAAGNVFVTGETAQVVTIGDQTLEGNGGAADMLVIKLSPEGAPLWVKRFGAVGVDYGRAVRATADGGVIVLGEMSRAVDFGGGKLESAGNRDAVVVSLAADGTYRWATRLGGTNDELAIGLAVDPVGAVVLTGSFDGQLDFGGQSHRAVGLADAYVAKLGPDGAPAWFRSFGSKESDIGAGVASDAAGNLYAVGWFWYDVDFGKGKLTSTGRKDAYAVALAPDGSTLWAQRFGGKEGDFLQSVATGPDGAPVAVGTFHGTVSFGGPDLTASAAPKADLPLGDVVLVGFER